MKNQFGGGRWRSGISRRPMYRGYSPHYSRPRFESRTRRPLLCVIPPLSALFPVTLYYTVIEGMKKAQKNNYKKKKNQFELSQSNLDEKMKASGTVITNTLCL